MSPCECLFFTVFLWGSSRVEDVSGERQSYLLWGEEVDDTEFSCFLLMCFSRFIKILRHFQDSVRVVLNCRTPVLVDGSLVN